jgi:hypothetical protein
MMLFFPYTYISAIRLQWLSEHFPGLTVILPSSDFIHDKMRQLVDQGKVNLRLPESVDPLELKTRMDGFKAWAQAHPKGIGDLKTYFQLHQDRPPLVDESSPTQIGDQIRHLGQTAAESPSHRVNQSALLLGLAHVLDEQQEVLEKDMHAIQKMEARMFSNLSGDSAPSASEDTCCSQPDTISDSQPIQLVSHGHMVNERIQAWATLAADDSKSAWAYITTGPLVMETILDAFPESIPMATWDLEPPDSTKTGNEGSKASLSDQLKRIAFGPLCTVPEEIPPSSSTSGAQLVVHAVPDCPPSQALKRLAWFDGPETQSAVTGDHPVHTLFGLVTMGS